VAVQFARAMAFNRMASTLPPRFFGDSSLAY
jgi:hypothetical protein